ncbi:hypothetical protein EDC94DRAFT_525562 [Helicostylum pulchrum]|nr:hypothetical protein EDC94DRAFT_525562 [Helicostylum pulchrum]
MTDQVTEKKPDLKELAKTLSDAYYSVLQYSNLTEEKIVKDLDHLAKYSNDLPLTWFTPQFLDTLLLLKDKYLPYQLPALASIIILFSSWLRRLSTTDDARLSIITDALLSILLNTDSTYLPVQKDAWIGWVALIGKGQDMKLLQGMTKVIQVLTDGGNMDRIQSMAEPIDAGVAHALAQTTALNDFEVEYCQELLDAHIQFSAKRSEGPRAIMTAIEHIVDVRSQEKPQTRAEADLSTLVHMANDVVAGQTDHLAVNFVRLAVLAGVVRMLQFNQGKKTKKVLDLREKAEKTFIQQLDMAVDTVTSKKNMNNYTTNQDIIAFFAGRCIIQIPSATVLEMNHLPVLLKLLSNSLLTSAYTFNNGSVIHRLKNTAAMTNEVNQLIEQPLFKDIGRISRAIAKINELLLLEKLPVSTVQSILDRLVGFSYNVFFDWDRYLMEHSSKKMTAGKSIYTCTILIHFLKKIDEEKNYKGLENAVWTIFKSMTFAFTVILKSVAVDVPDDDIPSVELLSIVKQSRLTFFSDLVEQVMSSIDDTVLENDILPVIYPILKWKRIENKDLYESAHTAVISAFLAEKPVSRELAGVYSKILIENFPVPMNLDQFRFGFNTLIEALCGMDDALAWLTVKQLIIKIESLTSEKDIVLRNQYTTALIDLLKPLSLGPFFPSILDETKKLIFSQETKAMQKATMKILFETVSGTGISDMRRTEAVGWFLELKQKLKL